MIPESVTTIGNNAFHANTLVNWQGNYSFRGSQFLGILGGQTSFSLPSTIAGINITSIATDAFSNQTQLSYITIPPSITSISSFAFQGCTGLTSIIIPKSVTSIGQNAFNGCHNLTIFAEASSKPNGWDNLWNPHNQTVVWSFNSALPFAITDGAYYVLEGGETVLRRYIGNESQFSLPDSVVIDGVSRPVTSIMRGAFEGANNLELIELPFIGERADGTGATHFGWIFGSTHAVVQGYHIPQSLKTVEIVNSGNSIRIEDDAFHGCANIWYIHIPANVTYISDKVYFSAFEGCSSLIKIIVNGGNLHYASTDDGILYDIEKTRIIYVPHGISGDIELPSSLISISERAFENRVDITSIVIPESVTHIGLNAFSNTVVLEIEDDVIYAGNWAVGFLHKNGYYDSNGNFMYEVTVSLRPGTVGIADRAFSSANSLTSIHLPDSLKYIGNGAFWFATKLAEIDIPEGVVSIGEEAFLRCDSLRSVKLPDSLTYLGYRAFFNCGRLLEINLPIGIEHVKAGAFLGCSNLAKVIFSSDLREIDAGAFAMISELTSIVIPNSVERIGQGAFHSSFIETISLPFVGERADGMGARNFDYIFRESELYSSFWLRLDSATIMGGDISSNAFNGLDELTNVVLSSGVVNVEANAFQDCTNLTIYVEEESQPLNWATNWNSGRPVIYGTTLSVDTLYIESIIKTTDMHNGHVISAPSRADHVFSGWNTATDGSGTNYLFTTQLDYNAIPNGTKLYTMWVHVLDIINVISNDELIIVCDNTLPKFEAAEFTIRGVESLAFFYGNSFDNTISEFNLLDVLHLAPETYVLDTLIIKYRLKFEERPWTKNFEKEVCALFGGKLMLDGITYEIINSERHLRNIRAEGNYILTHNINIDSNWTPLSINFSGLFNGNGNSITAANLIVISDNLFANNNGEIINLDDPYAGLDIVGNTVTGYFGTSAAIAIPEEVDGIAVTSIAAGAFADNTSLTSVSIPHSVTSIGLGAFSGTESLENLSIPFSGQNRNGGNNTHFGYIFGAQNMNGQASFIPQSLKTVRIDGLNGTQIANNAFNGIGGVETVIIADGVTTIGSDAFRNNSALTFIEIASTVSNIANAFGNSPNAAVKWHFNAGAAVNNFRMNLTEVVIPDTVTALPNNAFRDCVNLVSVTIPASVTSIGNSAFQGCVSLTEIALPASVTEIGAHAFNGATSLTDIIIPHGVTTIRDNTFSGCSALTSIVIPASVTQIQSDAFRNCNALTTVYYGGESAAQFNAINTGNNAQVVNATRYYYSETEPATQGNFWHFADGVPTAW
ncbi:MAG: leucine-rich repeat domain-containing protein [Firmicutes bacterium]|nr:leucine-rich repeat domain-containing protein [Bacillota bacterium]